MTVAAITLNRERKRKKQKTDFCFTLAYQRWKYYSNHFILSIVFFLTAGDLSVFHVPKQCFAIILYHYRPLASIS